HQAYSSGPVWETAAAGLRHSRAPRQCADAPRSHRLIHFSLIRTPLPPSFPGMKPISPRPAGIVAAIVFLAANFQLRAQLVPPDITPSAVLGTMQRVADWELGHPSAHKPTDWTQAAGDAGMMALAGISGDPKYRRDAGDGHGERLATRGTVVSRR